MEAADAERHPLDPLHEVVDRLGGSVADVGAVPGDDLARPPPNGAPETADIERHPGVGLPQLVTALAHLDRCDAEISRHTVGTRTEDTGLDSTE